MISADDSSNGDSGEITDPFSKPRLTFTKPFANRATPELLCRFSRRFDSVTSYFPEVRGEIRVGMTTSYKGLAFMESDGETVFRKICFPPLDRSGLPTCYVMGHELMHIVSSRQRLLPKTERSCDLFTLARLPATLIDHPPIYLRLPRIIRRNWSGKIVDPVVTGLAHDLAIEAIITRDSNSRYIQWWEREFEKRIADHLETCGFRDEN